MALLDLLSDVKRYPAECIVEVDGAAIEDLYPVLVEVEVDSNRSQWTVATLTFESRRMEDGTWLVQDDERFRPWVPVKIEAAFGKEREEVMRGYIREVRAEYPAERGGARVTVTCQDESILLDRLHVEQRWGEDTPTTDGQVAATIADRNGLSLLSTPGEGQTIQDVNQNTTDVRFLQRRAQANGYEIIFREGKLHFGEMRLDIETQPNLTVYAGSATNCISFNVRDDGNNPDRFVYQVAAEVGTDSPPVVVEPNLRVLGNEPANSSNSGLTDFSWRPQRQGNNDDTQMAAIAQQAANEASMHIRGEGELDGSLYGHVLRVGEPVGVDGAGEKNSGTYYVDSAKHQFDSEGYRVTFGLIRNAYGDDLAAVSNPLEGIL